MERMKEKCNWRGIGSLLIITVCLVSVMSPAMTQSSLSLFSNASNATDGEIPEPTPTPTIISFAPDSPVYNFEIETRTFNISIDQVVNVSWLLNGTEVQIDTCVTEASYTNTSPAVGTWNVSAVTYNENGTVMHTWIWNVSSQATPTLGPAPSPLPITTSTPTPTPSPTPVINETLVDLIISAIYTPSYILKDNETRINVTIQNIGTNTNSSGAFNVTFYVEKESGEGSYENRTKTRVSGLSAGSSENKTFSWIPTSVGLYNITVFADSEQEVKELDEINNNGNRTINVTLDPHNVFVVTNETNNTQIKPAFVNGTDLAVISIEIPCNLSNPCYRGKEVNINATISNLGAIDMATNFTVFFKEGIGGGNTSGFVFYNKTIQRLNSSENVSIPATWKPLDFGWHTITVSIPFDSTDDNETNNEGFKNVPVKSEYDFSVEHVSVEPEVVKECEHVNITATIGNLGLINGSVNVSFYVNVTDFVGSGDDRFIEIGRTEQPVYMEVGKTNNTSITWRANITGGDHLIFAVVDPDDEFIEWPDDTNKLGKSIILKNQTLAGNNVKSSTLHVIKSDWNITLTLEPPQPVVDDLVNVTAKVKNEGGEKANSMVWFYMEKDIPEKVHKSGNKGGSHVVSSLSQPENMTMRVHFKYINISNDWGYLGGTKSGFWGYNDIVRADVDDQPVDFYVRSDDVADDQPIKVAPIDFNTSCGECMNYGMHKGEPFCAEKRWNDIWTEWGYGKDLEVKVITEDIFEIEIYIDKYQVRLGNRTITLNAGECMPYNVIWNTSSLKPGENYTLVANVEHKVERNETFLGLTDLAVTNLSVEKEVLDGNQVWINATVENVGRKNATAFLINFTEIYEPTGGPSEYGVTVKERYNNYKLVNSTNIATGLEVGNATNISVRWNASIRNITCEGKCIKFESEYLCKWIETAENYTIKVEIIPLDNIEVEKGNKKEEEVHVKRSRDFSITNLSFIVNNNETRSPDSYGKVNLELGENVTLNTTLNITNLANRGGMVNVSFYIDEIDSRHEIGNYSTNFSANETKSVEWTFGEVNIAGDHNLIVVVDPENKIHEINELNNEYIQQIHVRAPELTVTSLNFDPDNRKMNKNESINITVEVANHGDKDATNVSSVVYDCADRHIEDADIRVSGSEVYPDLEKQEIERENATAMKLYLDLDIEGGEVCITDSRGNQIICPCYRVNFHGWTPWIFDNNVTIEAISNKNSSAFAKVSKIYYLKPSEIINTTTIDYIGINDNVSITVKPPWTASTGEHFIYAIIDPENEIPEYNELNNTLARYITVQTADLAIEDINLTWLNGTLIGNDEIIKDNDTVRIVANITNIGVKSVENFDVRILVDDDELINETKYITLMSGNSWLVDADWTAKVGTQVIKIEADYHNEINEANEMNNIEAKEIYVYGAEVSGNTSWESLGLHGTILFDPSQPYDEDDVNITTVINNSGRVNAMNFSVALLFDYKPSDTYHKTQSIYPPPSINRSYDNAVCLYLYIEDINPSWHKVFAIYDRNDIEVARTDRSCWVHVLGDTAKIKDFERCYSSEYNISFYPIYESNLTRIDRLDINSSTNVSMNVTNVTAGNHTVMLFIDPDDKVPEDVDNKTDNIVTMEMNVLPTRDFTVTKVIPERTNIYDADVITVTANVSNVGYRNGTTEVRFVDYENETRIHKYYFNRSLNLSEYNLSYLPVSPDGTLSSQYENLTIIHRPGVDAIHLNYSWTLFRTFWSTEYNQQIPPGEIRICNETGDVWNAVFNKAPNPKDWDYWVKGDTVYIYTTNADFNLIEYTTRRELPCEDCEDITLNASVAWNETTKNITAMRSESKNRTAMWNASTGEHSITVIIDPDNEISEIKETNNTYALPLRVNATKDIGIVNLNISPRYPCNEDNVTIIAVARNKGTEKANFTVDLWMDTIKDSSYTPVPHDWNVTIGGKRRYITLLNHTELSLAPGEKANVTAIWENMSVYGNPNYVVRAIVDPLDEIDEINEGNNEMSTEIIMDYPDFNVTGFNSPTNETKNASVDIENIGADDASNVKVRLELCRHKHEEHTPTGGPINITKEGAVRIRVYFLELDTTGEKASINIYGIGEDGKEYKVKTYSGEELQNEWSPWVKGDTIIIDYCGAAGFYIDECEWGDEYIPEIPLNASESVNVSLPERWNKYEGLAILYATVDPYDEIVEQREDNNNRTVMIYADLVPKEVGTVFSEDKLKGINVTILNNKTIEEEEGIVFPVCNFSVELCYSSGETIQRKRIGENETIYGGEEGEREVLFDVNESVFAANRTYNIDVIVDSEKEIEEIKEDNNEISTEIGPDIVVGIDISTDVLSCNSTITAIVKNEGSLPAKDFYVRLYLNSTKNETEDIFVTRRLGPNEEENVTFSKQIAPNKIYNVTIIADPPDQEHPRGRVIELDDENNEEEKLRIGPDLEIRYIAFYDEEGDQREGDKLIVNENHTISVMVNNRGSGGAKDFVLDFWINNSNNETIPDYPEKRTIDYCVIPEVLKPVNFSWKPEDKGFYYIKAFVDPKDPVDNVTELDDDNNFYPSAPNEDTWRVIPGDKVKVGGPNYKAKTDDIIAHPGSKYYGGMYYDASGAHFGSKTGVYPHSVTFENRIPQGGKSVFARLYLYMYGYKEDPANPGYDLGKLPEVVMNFYVDGELVEIIGPSTYEEFPDATRENYTYATYAYNVLTSFEAGDSLKAEVLFDGKGAIYGAPEMGLLVAYGDDDGVLTKYYYGEEGDIIMAKNNVFPTGFEYDDCTRRVIFNDVDDYEMANTSLITALAFYESYGAPITNYSGGKPWGDLLLFNDIPVGEPPIDNSHFWKDLSGKIALTKSGERGEYVNVKDSNTATIQSRGNYFFLTNAFLNVRYPPDLEPSVDTSRKATAGIPYDIPVDINNLGLSKARNFTVIVSIDGEVFNETIDEIEEAGQDGSSKTLKITMPPAPLVETTIKHNVTVVVDPEDKVKELINEHYGNGEANNNWTGEVTVSVESGGGDLRPGGGGGTGEEWGEGTDTGEGGAGSGGEGTTGGAEGAVGETGGETITGRLMKGSVAQSEEGGGGKGEFSLVGFLLRLAMLAAAVSLVCVGYWLERRRQKHKQ